jgi:hypothetical protein
VVVVKRAEWPEPIPMGAGAHMDYLDFPPEAIELVSQFLLKWYNSDRWRDFFKAEREFSMCLPFIKSAFNSCGRRLIVGDGANLANNEETVSIARQYPQRI